MKELYEKNEYLQYIKEWKEINKELINSGKCKKMFYENLPKYDEKGRFLYDLCIGYKVYYIYNFNSGWIEILDFNKNNITIKYEDNNYNLTLKQFKDCSLSKIINKCYTSSKVKLKTRTSDFKLELNFNLKDCKKDITIINREKRKYRKQYKKWYKYKCNKCGYSDGWIEESNLLKGYGCACCSGRTVVEGINDIPTTNPWMVKYFQDGYEEAKKYTCNCRQKIRPICPDCGKIYSKYISISNINLMHGFGCSCKDSHSKINKYVNCLLLQLEDNKQINNFEIEKRFKWCKYYNHYKNKECIGIYDFVVEELKLIIETDGAFHRQDNNMNGQTKEESKFIDDSKDLIASINGYSVVRISDEGDFKENILNSKLNNIFNLNNINWSKCLDYSIKNIYKEICFDYICYNVEIDDLCKKYKYSKQYIKNIINKYKNVFIF